MNGLGAPTARKVGWSKLSPVNVGLHGINVIDIRTLATRGMNKVQGRTPSARKK